MLGRERLDLGDDVRVPAECEVGFDPILDRGELEFLESGGFDHCERVVGELGQRRAAPLSQGLADRDACFVRASCRERAPPLLEE